MAIKINSLKVDKLSEKSLRDNYLYKDMEFDLNPQRSLNKQLNKQQYLNDIAVLYDLEAVKNSIVTAFSTSPGQKILNPTYGVDLRQYLFEVIDNFIAMIIQDDIRTKLPEMEPRITVVNVSVVGNADDQTYSVFLQINVPSLDIYGVSLKAELSSSGFTII